MFCKKKYFSSAEEFFCVIVSSRDTNDRSTYNILRKKFNQTSTWASNCLLMYRHYWKLNHLWPIDLSSEFGIFYCGKISFQILRRPLMKKLFFYALSSLIVVSKLALNYSSNIYLNLIFINSCKLYSTYRPLSKPDIWYSLNIFRESLSNLIFIFDKMLTI